jgi:hypothetical protein
MFDRILRSFEIPELFVLTVTAIALAVNVAHALRTL